MSLSKFQAPNLISSEPQAPSLLKKHRKQTKNPRTTAGCSKRKCVHAVSLGSSLLDSAHGLKLELGAPESQSESNTFPSKTGVTVTVTQNPQDRDVVGEPESFLSLSRASIPQPQIGDEFKLIISHQSQQVRYQPSLERPLEVRFVTLQPNLAYRVLYDSLEGRFDSVFLSPVANGEAKITEGYWVLREDIGKYMDQTYASPITAGDSLRNSDPLPRSAAERPQKTDYSRLLSTGDKFKLKANLSQRVRTQPSLQTPLRVESVILEPNVVYRIFLSVNPRHKSVHLIRHDGSDRGYNVFMEDIVKYMDKIAPEVPHGDEAATRDGQFSILMRMCGMHW